MSTRVRRAAVTAAATLLCAGAATPARAQQGGAYSSPVLTNDFPGKGGVQRTPTPSPTPRATRTARPTPEPTAVPTRTPRPRPTPTPTPTASPEPTATAKPDDGGGKGNLPETGSDPLRVGLMGLTLLGFGFSVRLGVGDARRQH